MSTLPLVSAIVPTKDRADLCVRAVESILGQTYPELECIVIDDGSTDGTMAVLQARFGDRIRILRNDTSRGVAAARNSGIDISRGSYVAFLDSDDEWLREKIERQVSLAEDSGAGVVYCGVLYVSRQGDVVDYHRPRLHGDVSQAMLWENVAGSPSAVLVRRSLLETGGLFREGIFSEDWDLWLRLAFRCSFEVISEPLVRIDVEPGSRHRSMPPEEGIASVREIYAFIDEHDPRARMGLGRRRREAAIHYFAGAQSIFVGQRMRGMRFYGKSIAFWPWQARVYRGIAVALLPETVLSVLKKIRARIAPRAAGIVGGKTKEARRVEEFRS